MLDHQENFKICGYRIPHYFWYVLSGALCDVVQAVLDYIIYSLYVFEFERATVCWTLSYMLSIIVRHSSHRYIVFGEYEGSYCASLGRTGIILIFSSRRMDHYHALDWTLKLLSIESIVEGGKQKEKVILEREKSIENV